MGFFLFYNSVVKYWQAEFLLFKDTKIKNYERVSMVVGDVFDKYASLFWGNRSAGR